MIFYLATLLLILSGIPQTIKLIKSKRSQDISVLMYVMTIGGVSLLFIKSINIEDYALILGNGVSLLFLLINLSLTIRYRKK